MSEWGQVLGGFAKELPAWILALIVVFMLAERMGFIQRRARRTDAVEGPAFETMGASADTAHHEVVRLSDLCKKLGEEITRLNGECSKYHAENLGQAHTIRRVNESRARLLDLLVKANRLQNDLIAANLLDEKLISGVTVIQTEFEDTRLR